MPPKEPVLLANRTNRALWDDLQRIISSSYTEARVGGSWELLRIRMRRASDIVEELRVRGVQTTLLDPDDYRADIPTPYEVDVRPAF